jgi:hypothetical protein
MRQVPFVLYVGYHRGEYLFIYAADSTPGYYYLPPWAARSSSDEKLRLAIEWGDV